MAKVFVSYSRKDITFAKRLTAELQKSEMDFWIDWEGIPPTVDWWREIEKGIEESDVFLFLISPDSSASRVCDKEIDTAVRNAKRIIPLVVRDVKSGEAPGPLSHLNWIFSRESDDFSAALQKLLTAIQTDYEWAATHRRLQVKALDWERNNKETGFLLRGADLLDAEQDLATNTSKEPHPTDLQREYVFESRKATDQQRRITTGISFAATIALAVLAAFGFYQADQAEKQAQIASARELAAQAADLQDKDFGLALLLGIAANKELTTLQSYEVMLENVQSHPRLRAYLSGHLDAVLSVAFSPDGGTLASGSRDRTIILWNTQAKKTIGQPLTGHTDAVTSVAFSPDGKILASGSKDGSIILWNMEIAKPIGQPLKKHTDAVTSVAFSPDGKSLASGSRDQMIMLWDVETGESIAQLAGHFDYVLTIAFSPDGKTLASGSRDRTILLWDLNTSQPVEQPLTQHTDYVTSVAFSPDGKILASGSRDETIILWDVETQEPIGGPLSAHTDDVASIAFTPDGKTLASGSRDKTIILWDMEKQEPIGQPLRGHFNSALSYVISVAFSPDGMTLASGSTDTNIILWDVVMHNTIARPVKEPTDGATNITFTPDSKTLALANNSAMMTFWDVADGRSSGQFTKTDARSLILSPDGRTLAYGTYDRTIALWDMKTDQQIGQTLVGDATSVTFSPDAKRLAFSAADRRIVVWDISEGTLITQFLDESADLMAFSPDSNILAVVNGTIIRLLNVTTGIADYTLQGHTQVVTAIAFSPDGKTLISGSNDTTIIRWDVLTGNAKGRPLEGHTQPITTVAFSPGGIFASGSCGKQDANFRCIEGEILLWDLVGQQPMGLPLVGHEQGITDLTFSPDGKTLASGSEDTTILLWDLDVQSWIMQSCRQANRNFTLSEWEQYFPNDPYQKTCDQFLLEQQVTGTKPSSPVTEPEQPANTVTPVIRPSTHTVQVGESIQCIARRYNASPKELLQLNAVADDLIYGEELPFPGLVLQIPQTANLYPGTRMLRNHPGTYIVVFATETLNQIACQYGDVDPIVIAAANGLSVDAELIPGQQLMIP